MPGLLGRRQRSVAAKKLARAARRWAEADSSATRPIEEPDRAAIAADLVALGIDPREQMAGWSGEQPSQDVDGDAGTLKLPVELERTIDAFLVGATQWRWMPWGYGAIPSGMDYGALRAALALARLRLTAEEFEGVRVMERAALPILQRRFSK